MHHWLAASGSARLVTVEWLDGASWGYLPSDDEDDRDHAYYFLTSTGCRHEPAANGGIYTAYGRGSGGLLWAHTPAYHFRCCTLSGADSHTPTTKRGYGEFSCLGWGEEWGVL